MPVEVRLLGPVEVAGDHGPADPGPAKRRALLATLALDANRPVSLSRLRDLLWVDPAPASAVANIRNHVGALRRILGGRLAARPGAYQLTLSPDELDVASFRRLADAGRDALTAGDASRAELDLIAALRLWRGGAGDGLPRGTALGTRLEGLDEHRLRVVEDLADVRLALGRDADLVGALREHLLGNPLRERAWGQLMLALYRAGDTGAALSAYARAYSVLRDQLGVEPGAELASLHRAVLDRAPRLDLPAGERRIPRARVDVRHIEVPRELPPDPVTLVGRSDELAVVLAAARPAPGHPAPAAVVVHGPSGSGKSALVTRAGHRLAPAFPDGQIYMTATGAAGARAADLLGRALRALGVAPADVPEHLEERIGRYRSLLAARRVLVVVDGAGDAEQVRPMVPAHPGSALVVAGPDALSTLDGVPHIELRPLSPADGRALLATYIGTDRLGGDVAAADDLIRRCAGLPRPLRAAAARLVARPHLPVRTLAEAYGRQLPVLHPGPDCAA